MAYEILAGSPPFSGNAQQVIAAHPAEYYRKYIAVFKNPDPAIARQVETVQQKLSRVTGEQIKR